MTGPFHTHEPSAEFKAHLEWQLETAMRRESRLAEPVTSAPLGGLRRFGTAVLVLIALAVGGAAGIASERVQDAKTRNQLLENAMADQALLKTRYELAQADLKETQRRFEVGAAGREELADAVLRAHAAELALERLQIDMMEIEKTSAPPRDELTAPKVGNTDFVMKRLEVDLQGAQRQLAAAEEALAKAKERFAVGMGTNAALAQADIQMAAERTHLQELQMRADLRKKYLLEQLSAEQLIESMRRAELMLQADLTRQQLAFAKARLESIKGMVEIGTTSQLDLKRAEVELLELEVKFEKIRRQLGAIGKKEQ
jgi:hypothetical protein